MSTNSPPSSAATNPADDDDENDGADAAAPPAAPLSSSSGHPSPPPAASPDDGAGEPPPPLDYSALAARIAALPTADEVVDGGTVHRFDTIEAEDAAGYAAAYRSAVSLFLLLVGDDRGGGVGGGGVRGGGVGGGDVYALAVGRDRVALVFATRNDAVLYGRMMLAKGGGTRHRRELQPDDVERLCESGGMRMGFVPAGSLSLSRGDSLSKAGSAADGGGADNDDDVLADGGMDEREASAMREKFNKLFETDGGGSGA